MGPDEGQGELSRTGLGAAIGGPADPVGPFGEGPVLGPRNPVAGPPNYLAGLETTALPGFDRLTFVVDEPAPGLVPAVPVSYRLRIVERVVALSGQPVEVSGEKIIEVTMSPIGRVRISGTGIETRYDGPERFEPIGTSVIREVAMVEDFESTMVWAIGVPNGSRFAVARLVNPQRLVVDITAEGS